VRHTIEATSRDKEWSTILLEFTLDQNTPDVEFRIRTDGRVPMAVLGAITLFKV
jgi:hypothetical protein